MTGEDIKLANARVDASGRAGGGKVLIGGDWGGGNPNKSLVDNPSAKLESFAIPTATTVSVDAGTTINASATGRGNGGKVVLWSDSRDHLRRNHPRPRRRARAATAVSWRPRATSCSNYSGTTDTRAPKGTVGTLLLDPEDFYVNCERTSTQLRSDSLGHLGERFGDPVSFEQRGALDVDIRNESGDIVVDAHVSWGTNNNGTTNNNSLTLSAFHDILFMSGSQCERTLARVISFCAPTTPERDRDSRFRRSPVATSTIARALERSPSTTTRADPKPNQIPEPDQLLLSSLPRRVGVFGQQSSQLTAYMLVNNATTCRPSARISAAPMRWAAASARPASPGSLRERLSPDCSTAMAGSAPVPRSATITPSATRASPQPTRRSRCSRSSRAARRSAISTSPTSTSRGLEASYSSAHSPARTTARSAMFISSAARSPADRKRVWWQAAWSQRTKASSKTPARQPMSASARTASSAASPASTAARSCSRPRPGRSPPPARAISAVSPG